MKQKRCFLLAVGSSYYNICIFHCSISVFLAFILAIYAQASKENHGIKMSLKHILIAKSYVEMSVFRGMNSLVKFFLFGVFILLIHLIFNTGFHWHDFISAILSMADLSR